MDNPLEKLETAGAISALDIHFAKYIGRLNGAYNPCLLLAAALVSSYTRQGHICVGLELLGAKPLEPAAESLVLPEPGAWRKELSGSNVVGSPGEYKPLVLDEAGRLYLYRYWEYQKRLSDILRARMNGAAATPAPALGRMLDRLFPRVPGEVDWQKIAAFAGATRQFCVISGGPGTGKTTTVAGILALLLEQHGAGALRIALAAPTGKAAARLQEAIKNAKKNLAGKASGLDSIPESASTVHRLLRTVQGTPYFRHNEENPLPVDVLVIDEASMVDLALMSKLAQALPPHARLILLGDKDQLASVEAGAVLGDICDTGSRACFSRDFANACEKHCGYRPDADLIHNGGGRRPRDCIIQLRKSYRFPGSGGIARLSAAVKEGEADAALSILKAGGHSDLAWSDAPSSKSLEKLIRPEVVEGLGDYAGAVGALGRPCAEDPNERLAKVFELFERFRILAAVREGPFGVSALNALVEEILAGAGLPGTNRKWYAGRPVMVGRNDYSLKLFNGDVGIFLPDIFSGSEPRIFFPGPGGSFRSFHPLRIPDHETVFAMTVHKSQGSEFENVLLVLPERDSPVLTRELVYTGVTRARKKIAVLGGEQVLRRAVSRSAERLSGLSAALWGE